MSHVECDFVLKIRVGEKEMAKSVHGYLARKEFERELADELGLEFKENQSFYLKEGNPEPSVWSARTIGELEFHSFSSVGEAAKILKSKNKFWSHGADSHHRRAQLIQEQLPFFKSRPLDFLQDLKFPRLGYFHLLNANEMALGFCVDLPLAPESILFHENKVTPPSRAYLKLWELMTLYSVRPQKGEVCLDMGSCPGGWTWVLQTLGCQVISVDKAPLDEKIATLPGIQYLKRDAFQLLPSEVGPIDWFFSDVICYPERLLQMVHLWLDSGACSNFVCTIKFQGETDSQILKEFLKIPGSKIKHLVHNKHEVTWWLTRP